jgi:VanZ family protein
MATVPVLLNPSSVRSSRQINLNSAWIGALMGFVFVACTSNNYMGGTHSQRVLTAVWESVLGMWHIDEIAAANIWMRKVGHFIGHGLLSLVFCRAWYSSVRKKLLGRRIWWRPTAALLALLTTFTVACLDEWHQSFVPGRVGSFRDVLIDASGALVANLIVLVVMSRRKPQMFRIVERNRSMPLAA